ncbi:MAG: hypothetical protein KIT45_06705 [Fimbriimonadia bacterium]|nr:hypothetical protein [Fimbriimonadia bacterium]
MANIIKTNMDTIGFIPEIWANEILRVLRANSDIINAIARDSDFDTPQERGDVINITYPGTFAVQNKAEDTAISPAAPSGGAKVAVALSQYKTVDFLVEDLARTQSRQDLMERYTEPAVSAIIENIASAVHALYSGFSQSVGASGTDITAATVRTAGRALDTAKVPRRNRSLIVSSKDYYSLLGDSNLQSYFANAAPDTMRDGLVGRLYGFDVYLSQLVPVVTGSPDSTKNLALHRDAAILAFRPLSDPPAGSGAQSMTIFDEQTGVVMRVLSQYDMSHRGLRVAIDCLYGVAELRDAAGVVVLA